jgi:hypothetical protein
VRDRGEGVTDRDDLTPCFSAIPHPHPPRESACLRATRRRFFVFCAHSLSRPTRPESYSPSA